MSWKQVVAYLLGNAVFIALAAEIINHKFNKRLESYRYSQLKRQKAEVIAQLLAKWGKYRGGEIDIISKPELYDYYEELNRLSYEAILWIDDNLIDELEDAFAEPVDDIRPLLRHARKYVIESKDASRPEKIAIFPNSENAKLLFPHLFKKNSKKRS